MSKLVLVQCKMSLKWQAKTCLSDFNVHKAFFQLKYMHQNSKINKSLILLKTFLEYPN